jgi:hypothetical protein
MENIVQPTLDFVATHSNLLVTVMIVTALWEAAPLSVCRFPGTSLSIPAGP